MTINHPTIINNNNHYSEVSKLKYDLNEAKIIIQKQKDVIIKLENKLNNKENINDIIKSLKYEIESKNKELIELKSKINQIILKEVEQRLRSRIKRINFSLVSL